MLTQRQRYDKHASDAACASFRRLMDPLGRTIGLFVALGGAGWTAGTAASRWLPPAPMATAASDAIEPLSGLDALSAQLAGSAEAGACLARHMTMWTLGALE